MLLASQLERSFESEQGSHDLRAAGRDAPLSSVHGRVKRDGPPLPRGKRSEDLAARSRRNPDDEGGRYRKMYTCFVPTPSNSRKLTKIKQIAGKS